MMRINAMPAEVLDLIFECLEKQKLYPVWFEHRIGAAVRQQTLRTARLVCRQWDALATKRLFRIVDLMPNGSDKEFAKWKRLVSSKIVQDAARTAKIYSVRLSRTTELDRERDIWSRWEHGDWPEFVSAIHGIAELPNLRAANICFTKGCEGVVDSGYGEIVEKFSTRMHTIETVFKAIQQRKARATNAGNSNDNTISTITSLTMENLQNRPFDDFLKTDVFRSVVEAITELRLLVTHEDTEEDHDIDCEERHKFEPWLQKELLPCFANQLTSLHLSFHEKWGVAPGYFDGKGLHFPRLRSLLLGEYVIGHHDQFDWVLAQTTLETLCLDRCVIVSYLCCHSDDLQRWGQLPSHDWERIAEDHGYGVYRFSGTWEAVFDGIRVGLANLVEFRMRNVEDDERGLPLADELGCRLTAQRYTTFSSDTYYPWREADIWGQTDFTEKLEWFAENAGLDPEECEVNRAMDTEEGDMRAFKELVQAVEERARRRWWL